MPRQAGSCLSCQTLGGARVVCLLLPSKSRARIAAVGVMRLAHAEGSCGLSVLWRPAHGSLTLEPIKVTTLFTQAIALGSRQRDRMACVWGGSSLQARCLLAPFRAIAS